MATLSTLTFADQKNDVCDEVIGQVFSGSNRACSIRSNGQRLFYLCSHYAAPCTPLWSYYDNGRWCQFTSLMVTHALRSSSSLVGTAVVFLPEYVSCRSLQAGGAMAILCAQFYLLTIQLLGRWCLGTIIRYLPVQASPLINDIASRMLQFRNHHIISNQDVMDILPALEHEVAKIALKAGNPNKP